MSSLLDAADATVMTHEIEEKRLGIFEMAEDKYDVMCLYNHGGYRIELIRHKTDTNDTERISYSYRSYPIDHDVSSIDDPDVLINIYWLLFEIYGKNRDMKNLFYKYLQERNCIAGPMGFGLTYNRTLLFRCSISSQPYVLYTRPIIIEVSENGYGVHLNDNIPETVIYSVYVKNQEMSIYTVIKQLLEYIYSTDSRYIASIKDINIIQKCDTEHYLDSLKTEFLHDKRNEHGVLLKW